MNVLVIGASGYVGGRLVPLLIRRGVQVTLMSRDTRSLAGLYPAARIVHGDLLDRESLDGALVGIEVVYYLAHAMAEGKKGFAQRDILSARNFAQAAKAAGVKRVIYLGGLGADGDTLSLHLASRHLVGQELSSTGIDVTELRAAVIIGSGSASFEIIRHLTERLPVMTTPRWMKTRCQPISIRDVLAYLIGALDHPEITGVVEIGGADILSYEQMMLGYARIRRLHRFIIPTPFITPRLSSYWVSLVTPVPRGITQPLVEGLKNEVIVRDPEPAKAFGIVPLSYWQSLELAIDRTDRNLVESSWFDDFAARHRHDHPLPSVESREGMLIDRQQVFVRAEPAVLFAQLERIGGQARWPYAHVLWQVRGIADKLWGGIGMALGRSSDEELRVGDALDVWRVEVVDRPTRLRLRATMQLPGRAWLEFEIVPAGRGSRLFQTAFFEPRGLPGLAYWYGLLPVHHMIFRGMVRELAQRAVARAAVVARNPDGPDTTLPEDRSLDSKPSAKLSSKPVPPSRALVVIESPASVELYCPIPQPQAFIGPGPFDEMRTKAAPSASSASGGSASGASTSTVARKG